MLPTSINWRRADNILKAANSAATTQVGKCLLLLAGGVGVCMAAQLLKTPSVQASNLQKVKVNIVDIVEVGPRTQHGLKQRLREPHLVKLVQLTARERRFIKFASTEYEGQLYMTPQDFLESMLEQDPRPRLKRRILTSLNIDQIRFGTPPLKKGSSYLFRSLRDKGIISYTEYLFLLSILTKPQRGFHIAFRMFDTDGNQRVEKKEFLVIHKILGGSFKDDEVDENTRKVLLHLVSTDDQAKSLRVRKNEPATLWEYFFPDSRRQRRAKYRKREKKDKISDDVDDENIKQRAPVTTTLETHFFGSRGDNMLYYNGFHKFMEELQTEVLEIEFNEFAKNHTSISELEFAKILLRYTYLDAEKYGTLLDRLLKHISGAPDDARGISFKEFMDFCHFLNNLDDFAIAMRLYTSAAYIQDVARDEFMRAVKICTGLALSEHVVDTLFALFDESGNGKLAYKDFINIMRDRLYRGFKAPQNYTGLYAFKICVKNHLKYA